MIDQMSNSSQVDGQSPAFSIYKNKKSPMTESILVQYNPSTNTFSLHVYAIILPDISKQVTRKNVIDTRNISPKRFSFKLRVINQIKKGSLSFNRFFLKNPKEIKYIQRLREKYPKRKIITRKYFSPMVLLVAHYCNHYTLNQSELEEFKKEELIANHLAEFDNFLQDNVHLALRNVGKPLYLKGEDVLINHHQTRELSDLFLKSLTDENRLKTIASQNGLAYLTKIITGMRKERSEQYPLLKKNSNPKALSHILDTQGQLLSLEKHHFPIAIIGEPTARRNLVINILKNINAQFLILDSKENYGKLANANPRIRGYKLGANYFLNIMSTENDSIREQIYAYWFSKIISNLVELKAELTKTLETYLLGVYRDESNQTRSELQFKDFANQELTSEVTKMGRNESVVISNVLYPLGTYDEISILTRVGRSNSFETLFDTKGAIIQFPNNDDQLTKISYLFTLLKLYGISSDHQKIIVLENLDEIIGTMNDKRKSELSEMILSLSNHHNLILCSRSPLKIKELFKNSKSRFVNRLVMPGDLSLLVDDYSISHPDASNMKKLAENEYMLLMPESSMSNYLKIDKEIDVSSKIEIEEIVKESSKRILHSKEYLQNEGIAPEVKKAVFELIRILREKPNKMIPEEGIDQVISGVTTADVLRAKEIARDESLIRIVDNSPDDSSEKISLLSLTERGEKYYLSYLNLRKQIPLISLKNLAVERNFEKKINETRAKMDRAFEIGDSKTGIEYMIKISLQLLGALPEDERFISGLTAAKLLDHWSYITAIKNSDNFSKAKRTTHEFSQLVMNALKEIKNKILVTKTAKVKDKEIQSKEKAFDDSMEKEEFEYDFDLENQNDEDEKISVDERKINEETAEAIEPSDSSLFKEAAKDLRSAGMKYKDSNGDQFKPKKEKIFDEDFFEQEKDLEILNDNPFLPKTKEDSDSEKIVSESIIKLDSIKKNLMNILAEKLEIPFIDDEAFIWHCLESRFSGKIDDGFTISEFVFKMKQLYKDAESKDLISDRELNVLKKLLYAKNLISEKLIMDFKQYVQDK